MNLKLFVILLPIVFIIIGCTATKEKINIDTKPKLQVPKKVVPIKKRKGTLYSRSGASLFSDKKDLQVGDIIQVLVSETLTNESESKKTTSKANNTGINGGLFTPAAKSSTNTKSKIDSLNSVLGISLSGSSNNTFTGNTKNETDEEFVTTISAVIEQTYQNGNYFISGTKEILISGQKQIIKVSGVIRPYDISPDNTIKSNQLANLKILYDKRGDEMDSIEKPWASKILESISPF